MKDNLKTLKIWVKAHKLRLKIHNLVKTLPRTEKYKTGDQIERSSSSVADNIAEGYGAYYFNDKIKSFYNARKEAAETQNHLAFLSGKKLIDYKEAKKLIDEYEGEIKGINGYIRYISKKRDKQKSK